MTNDFEPVAPLPPSAYVDPERYERERLSIFAKEWIAIGDAAQLERPGAYLALTVANYPIVLVNDDGLLRGFHNVCRHRAGPMVWDGSGTCRSFVCRYHGWAYGLNGTLKSARDFGGPLPTEELSLHAVTVAEWRGLLFVNLDASPTPLLTWLGVLAPQSEAFDLEGFVVSHRSSHELSTNWKVYAENYQEGYHIPLIHPSLNKQVDSARYHVEVVGSASIHSAPTRDGSVTNGAWLWRFPSLALNIYRSGMCLESFWPTGPVTTRVEYTFFFAADTSDEEAEAAVDSSIRILEEDRKICESVQRNLASGIYRPQVLSPRHEVGVQLVHSLVTRALNEG